ncbi:transcription initiation factor IIB-like [Lolium perenne]|uniref:transcription initiation factor IIB-like n=1 Tax=Lolium perenne TaxID=4522 RepID=UPI0021F68CD9|nr:transcription initiation factor IIB-like [Lolium perenne]
MARAAERETLYSLYCPDGRRVTAASVVGCVCVDHLTCTECARILGAPFVAIELAAGKKQRTDPPAQFPGVDVGLRPGQSTGEDGTTADGFDVAISGLADPVRAQGFEATISGMADPVRDEGFEAGISGMADRLGLAAAVGERAKEVFRKMEEARAWHHCRGWTKDRSKEDPLVYAACLSIACRKLGSARSLRELALAAAADGGAAARKEIVRLVAHIRRRLGEEEAGQATVGMVCASSYVRRFGRLVALGEAEEAAALEAARRLDEGALDLRHNVESVAAAVVCLALERAGAARKPVKDVATATGITRETIYRVRSRLRPHADLLFG